MLPLMRALTKCGVWVLPSVTVSAISRSDTPILSQSECRTIVSVSRPRVRTCAVRQGKATKKIKKLFTLYVKLFPTQPRVERVFRGKLFAFLSVYSDKQLFGLGSLQLTVNKTIMRILINYSVSNSIKIFFSKAGYLSVFFETVTLMELDLQYRYPNDRFFIYFL